MLRKIGEIVARTRLHQKVAVEVLAKQASVDPLQLHALERGEPGISTAALDRVARQLELDGTALLRGEEVLRPRVSVFLRHSGAQDFDHTAQEALDRTLEVARTLRFLDERLGHDRGLREHPRLVRHESTSQPALDGYASAQVVRDILGEPVQPLGDLRQLLEERFEIAVMTAWLPLSLTAVSVRDCAGAAAVILNEHDEDRANNPQLARVYLAHELCHILFDPSAGGLHLVLDRREADDKNQRHVERAEQRARAFAAEFLLPLKGLTELLGPPERTESVTKARRLVAEARAHFSSPWDITANHLCNRKFIDKGLRELLVEQGARRTPPGPADTSLPPPGLPSRLLLDRVQRAHEEAILTDGQARVALGLAIEKLLPWDRRRAHA